MVNMAWDLEDCAFMLVLAVVRERAPCCRQFKVCKEKKKNKTKQNKHIPTSDRAMSIYVTG